MAQYETNYGIGDVVYTADAYKVEKQIITKIKISGLKHTVSYGFKEPAQSYVRNLWGGGETWYKSSEVFDSIEKAERKHKIMKDKQDLEAEKEEKREREERKLRLESELKELKEKK